MEIRRQARQDGVAFRFQDLRQAIFELREKVATMSKQNGYSKVLERSSSRTRLLLLTRVVPRSCGSSRRIIGRTPVC